MHTKRSKQIKNQWHRDDPCLTSVNVAFLVLCAFLVCLSYPRGLSLGSLLFEWLFTSLAFVLVHFVFFGMVMAALSRWVAHKYLSDNELGGGLNPGAKPHVPQGGHQVEPLYAFDIHCNGFFPVILFCYFGNALLMLFGLNKVS
mmetsp:Transcript_5724/g.7718  ORF Transcript_5724/g.7718 Transcript_5724/m.7718 type:complete len:144 (-) Transcript_5724:268-699(-)